MRLVLKSGDLPSAGDVIQVLLNDNGDISKLILRYNFSEGTDQKFLVNSLYSSSTLFAGVIYYTDEEQKTIIADGPDGKVVFATDKNTEFSVYNTKDKTLSEGTIADLAKDVGFVARVPNYIVREIVIYI